MDGAAPQPVTGGVTIARARLPVRAARHRRALLVPLDGRPLVSLQGLLAALVSRGLRLRGFATALKNSAIVAVAHRRPPRSCSARWPPTGSAASRAACGRRSRSCSSCRSRCPGLSSASRCLVFFARLEIDLSLRTVVLAHLVYVLPYFLLIAVAAFGRLDPALEEAGGRPRRHALAGLLAGDAPAGLARAGRRHVSRLRALLRRVHHHVLRDRHRSTLPMFIWSRPSPHRRPVHQLVSTVLMAGHASCSGWWPSSFTIRAGRPRSTAARRAGGARVDGRRERASSRPRTSTASRTATAGSRRSTTSRCDPGRRVRDAARALGLRQDDAAAGRRRLRPPERGHGRHRRARRHARPAAPAAGNMVFQRATLFPHLDVERNIGFGLRIAGCRRSEAQARWPRCCGSCASRATSAGARTSFRAARCSGSRSRGRSSTGRRCCCSTSRCRRSTSRSAWRWRSSSAACTARPAPRSSTSRTTSARRSRSPTASPSSTRAASSSSGRPRTSTAPLPRPSRPASWATPTWCRSVVPGGRRGYRRPRRTGVAARCAPDTATGPAWLVLRPEVVRLLSPTVANGRGLPGTVRDFAFRGSGYSYGIEVAGLDELLKAEVPAESGTPFELGSDVAVIWDQASCGLLTREEV